MAENARHGDASREHGASEEEDADSVQATEGDSPWIVWCHGIQCGAHRRSQGMNSRPDEELRRGGEERLRSRCHARQPTPATSPDPKAYQDADDRAGHEEHRKYFAHQRAREGSSGQDRECSRRHDGTGKERCAEPRGERNQRRGAHCLTPQGTGEPGQKRIRAELIADCGARSVTRVHHCRLGEFRDALEGASQRGAIRERKIRAADRSGEETVAREQGALAINDHVPRRMTRSVNHLEVQSTKRKRFPIREPGIGRRRWLERNAVHRCCLRAALVEGYLVLVDVNRNGKLPPNRGDSSDMIEVAVRQPDRFEAKPALLDCLQQPLAIVTGIDDRGHSRRRI